MKRKMILIAGLLIGLILPGALLANQYGRSGNHTKGHVVVTKTKQTVRTAKTHPVKLSSVPSRYPIVEANRTAVRVRVKPPAPKVEVIPPRPSSIAVWIPGYWYYDVTLGEFIWISGYWDLNPLGFRWIPAHWAYVDGYFVWTAGYWLY